jgi:transcriptional regulator with XRE-family HTH domain
MEVPFLEAGVTESDAGSSVVRRWQLAAALRGLREQAGLTQDQTIERLLQTGGRWSAPKLSRIEQHEQGVRPRDVEQLLDVYGVIDSADREPLLTLAAKARERDWVAQFGVDLPESTQTLASVEAGAVEIRQFETLLIPGLLQTTDYTRAVIEVANTTPEPPLEAERRISRRMTRQHILRRPTPPAFHVILDEGILRRPVGPRSVMRDQLRKLVDLADASYLTMQVLPLAGGAGPGLSGPFTLFSLPSPAPDLVYGEGGPAGMVFVEDRQRARQYMLRFGMLTQLALPRDESVQLILEAARSYE